MSRALRAMFLSAVLSFSSLASQALADDCKLAKGDTRVAKACAEGGVKKAKEEMKAMVKLAKGAGVKMECDDCHKDDQHYDQLTSEGKEKFKKLLAALEKK